MEYPGNFETPAFPAGRRIAISRLFAIWILIAMLLIIFLSGILLWSSRSDRLVPFLISTNNDTGEWTIVGRTSRALEYTRTHTFQESVVGNFAWNWFNISGDAAENEIAWQKCERSVCSTGDSTGHGVRACALFCASGDEIYSRFMYDVLPDYRRRADNGEFWVFDEKSMLISPVGRITDSGGTWQIIANVYSSVIGTMEIKAFVKIARNKAAYPQAMGFYVADFNAYRIN